LVQRTLTGRESARRRRERRIGVIGLGVAAALPVVLWHGAMTAEASRFSFDWRYLSGWTPWLLMALGLCFFLPVAASAGLSPTSRFYPRGRRAYLGWGITLYLLGFGLATQVAQLMVSVGQQ
jgi:hypothetical protein